MIAATPTRYNRALLRRLRAECDDLRVTGQGLADRYSQLTEGVALLRMRLARHLPAGFSDDSLESCLKLTPDQLARIGVERREIEDALSDLAESRNVLSRNNDLRNVLSRKVRLVTALNTFVGSQA